MPQTPNNTHPQIGEDRQVPQDRENQPVPNTADTQGPTIGKGKPSQSGYDEKQGDARGNTRSPTQQNRR